MRLSSYTRGVVAVVSAVVLTGCPASRPTPQPGGGAIEAGRGFDSPLARKLAEGTLVVERPVGNAPGEEPARPIGTLTGGVTVSRSHGGTYAGPGDTGVNQRALPATEAPVPQASPVPLEAPRNDPALQDSEAAENKADDDAPAKLAATRDPAAKGAWQRSAHRPSFARVHLGAGNALVLERMRVTVTIEGPRARTVVDHVFKNPHDKQLEGTFQYPLPAGASACYYGMFLSEDPQRPPEFFREGALDGLPPGAVAMLLPDDLLRRADDRWGTLRQAKVVERARALEVYEEVVRKKIDPGLLEYAGGNTFEGRVFPIPPRGFNRVVISYEQPLDVALGRATYRFPLPDCELGLLHVTATIAKSDVASESLTPQADAARHETKDRIAYDLAWEKTKGPGGELVWTLAPKDASVQAIASRDPTSSKRAFYARVRPELPADVEHGFAEHAVFLVDTSLSEDPDRFHTSLAVLRQILEKDAAIRWFNVICFDVGAWWVAPGQWLANDAAGRRTALDALQGVLLEGATDLGHALDVLLACPWQAQRVPLYTFLLTDGQLSWGERDPVRLAALLAESERFEPRVFCYRTGLSAENLELFGELTRRGGGVFNVMGEAAVATAALAHRKQGLVVESIRVEMEKGAASDVVVAGRQATIHPGGEMVIAGRCDAAAKKGQLVVSGRLGAETKDLRFPLDLSADGELAARGWAEIAVAQMLAVNEPEVDKLAVAYAQRFGIGSRATSFLVLETDQEYEQYGIDAAAKELAVADVGAFLGERFERQKPLARRVAFSRFLREAAGRVKLMEQGRDEHVQALFSRLREDDFAPASPPLEGALPRRGDVPPGYLEARGKQRDDARLYLGEAQRRFTGNLQMLGLRALSTIVENQPARGDALRLVGYRLLQAEQPGLAAGLFERVREQRPFEPHSYRDLARSLEALGRPALAAIHYEILLAGQWHGRFHESLPVVAREEYVRMLRQAAAAKSVRGEVLELFGQRLEELAGTETQADLRVTITWNSDDTDVDLWIVEPSGEACGYSHRKTAAGGELLDDLTQGYGPERYRIVKAPAGDYAVLVHYYRANPNLIAGESHVEVVVTRHAGLPEEETKRFTVVLDKEKQGFEVCRVRL